MTDGEKREAAYRIIDALKEDVREEYAMILERDGDAFSLCAEDALYEFSEEDALKKVRNVLEREFFVFICEKIQEKRVNADYTPYGRAVRFIRKNYQNNINAEDVAQAANCTRARLEREFYEKEKRSVSEYLRKIRAFKAAELMAGEPSITLRECAQLCGFGSEKTMVRAFKMEFNMTPREYAGREK
ncbi:MAG: AraC family transcriptional regulator [Clostridia bacterium]|nr:AraC family transcriptional regulator [Clostridia bacterium]